MIVSQWSTSKKSSCTAVPKHAPPLEKLKTCIKSVLGFQQVLLNLVLRSHGFNIQNKLEQEGPDGWVGSAADGPEGSGRGADGVPR